MSWYTSATRRTIRTVDDLRQAVEQGEKVSSLSVANLAKEALLTGDLNTFNYLLNNFEMSIDSDLISFLIKRKNIDLLKAFVQKYPKEVPANFYPSHLTYAVQTDNPEIVDYMLALGLGLSRGAFLESIYIGNPKIVRRLMELYLGHGWKPDMDMMRAAKRHPEIYSMLEEHFKEHVSAVNLEHAVAEGTIDDIRQAMASGEKITKDVFRKAQRRRDVNIVKFLLDTMVQQGYDLDPYVPIANDIIHDYISYPNQRKNLEIIVPYFKDYLSSMYLLENAILKQVPHIATWLANLGSDVINGNIWLYAMDTFNKELIRAIYNRAIKQRKIVSQSRSKSASSVYAAVLWGDPEIVHMALTVDDNQEVSHDSFIKAIDSGNPEIIKMLLESELKSDHDKKVFDTDSVAQMLIKKNDVNILRMFLPHMKEAGFSIPEIAHNKNKEFLKEVQDSEAYNQFTPTSENILLVVLSGDSEIFDMAIEGSGYENAFDLTHLRAAFRTGNEYIYKKVYDGLSEDPTGAYGNTVNDIFLELLVKRDMKAVEFLREKKFPINHSSILDDALRMGDPFVIDYILNMEGAEKDPTDISRIFSSDSFFYIYKNHRDKLLDYIRVAGLSDNSRWLLRNAEDLEEEFDFSPEVKILFQENPLLAINFPQTMSKLYKSGEINLDKVKFSFPEFEYLNPSELEHADRFMALSQDLSEYTQKEHIDHKEIVSYLSRVYELFKKDHHFESSPEFDKMMVQVLYNQYHREKRSESFITLLNKLSDNVGPLTGLLNNKKYKNLVKNFILKSSKDVSLSTGHDNTFFLATLIPEYIESRQRKLEEEGMVGINENFPEKGKPRFDAIKKLRNEIKNNIRIPVTKSALQEYDKIQNNWTYKDHNKMMGDVQEIDGKYKFQLRENVNDSVFREFLFDSKEDLDFFDKALRNIIDYKDSFTYSSIAERINDVIMRDPNFGKGHITPKSYDVEVEGDTFTFTFLDKKDPLGLVLGETPFTGCCQKFGGVAETSMIEGYVNPDSGFLVVYKGGDFQAQSWVWLTDDNETLVLDNVEFSTELKDVVEAEDDQYDNYSDSAVSGNVFEKIFEPWATPRGTRSLKEDKGADQSSRIRKIQEAYKKFAQMYKAEFGRNVFIGGGYDSLGVNDLGEYVEDWEVEENYPKMDDEYIYLDDSSDVYKVASWYRRAKYMLNKNLGKYAQKKNFDKPSYVWLGIGRGQTI